MTAAEERLRLYGERNNLLSTDVEFAATMIRAAIAEEREASAKLAEDLFPRINGPGWLSQDMRGTTAKNIAAAIRARKDA